MRTLILLLLALMAGLTAATAQESAAPTEVSALGMDELERLLQGVAVAAGPASAGGAVSERPVLDAAERVDALERFLRSVSKREAIGVIAFLHRLMRDSDEGIRITAMNWLVGRYNFGVEAIEKGLMDRSDLVRLAALERLLDCGLDSKSYDEVKEAAKRKDLDSIRVILLKEPKLRR
jgi:hypothetical protein